LAISPCGHNPCLPGQRPELDVKHDSLMSVFVYVQGHHEAGVVVVFVAVVGEIVGDSGEVAVVVVTEAEAEVSHLIVSLNKLMSSCGNL